MSLHFYQISKSRFFPQKLDFDKTYFEIVIRICKIQPTLIFKKVSHPKYWLFHSKTHQKCKLFIKMNFLDKNGLFEHCMQSFIQKNGQRIPELYWKTDFIESGANEVRAKRKPSSFYERRE